MSNEHHGRRPARRRYQFSLRTLMFITSVVCFAAALSGISPMIALGAAPFLAAAMFRTLRVVGRAQREAPATRVRLFASFAQSLLIVVSLVVVAMVTSMAAALIGSIWMLELTVRAARMAFIVIHRLARFIRRTAIRAWKGVRPVALRINLPIVLYAVRERAVGATRQLIQFCRWQISPAGQDVKQLRAAAQ
jgi:hypothetical protein